ncbi:MAG: HAMP domain-containing protein [Gammaproteobacteria bacterium]|nr:HAMP domain-containing protein [Gammaproteobacteria bacterium]
MFNSLRTRMEIYTVLAILFTAGILIAVFSYQLYQSKLHLLDALAGKQTAISKTVLEKAVSQMEKNIFSFTRDEKLVGAIQSGDKQSISALVSPTANRLEATGAATNLRILGLDGAVLFTRNAFDASNISLKLAKESVDNVIIMRGLEAVNGHPEVHFVFPMTEKGQVYSVIDISMDYANLSSGFATIAEAEFLLFDLQGNLLNEVDPKLESALLESGIDVTRFAINELEVGEKALSVVSQPLKDHFNNTVAYVVTMMDDTEINTAQKMSLYAGLIAVIIWILTAFIFIKIVFIKSFRPLESMNSVVNSISQKGDFSQRIPVESKDEIGVVAVAINEMVETLQKTIAESNRVMNAVASGDFSQRIKGHSKGDLETLQQAVNNSTQSVDHTMSELLKVVGALANGDFSVRMDRSIEGQVREQVEAAMITMSDVITQVNSVLANMANGDFTQRVKVEAQGELKSMAENVNSSTQQTAKALDDILSVVSALSEGNLTHSISARYEGKFAEVAHALNESLQNVSALISETRNGVHNLVHNVEKIHQGSQDLNARTQRQASALEKTTATMGHITETVKQTTDNANAANQLATTARSQADAGAEVMRSTIESMTDIREASHKIEEIIALIDSIAFQTNLLALNAAVEAARAGEHGRGFAVVAGEVRNLAGKSADAARDIKGLIENAVSAVEQGTERAERSDQALQTITEGIRKVSDIVAEITAASGEQSISIREIGEAIHDLESVTQQNASLVEQSSTSSKDMKEDALQLQDLVSQFKV